MTDKTNEKSGFDDAHRKATPDISELKRAQFEDGETLAETMAEVSEAKGQEGTTEKEPLGLSGLPLGKPAAPDEGNLHREGQPQEAPTETIEAAITEAGDEIIEETTEEERAEAKDYINKYSKEMVDEEKLEADEAAKEIQNVKVKINGINVSVPEGSTILEAALAAGIKIPTLCYLKGVNAIGSCRMCVVEVKGARTLVAACVYPVNEGMEVQTDSDRVREARKINMELILSNHRMDCLTCERSNNCELRTLSADLGVDEIRFKVDDLKPEFDTSAEHLIRDNSKCILCRRCVAVCHRNEEVGVIGAIDRGYSTHIGSEFDRGLGEVSCVACGQCIANCPTGALTLKRQQNPVLEALADPDKIVVALTAPAVRVGLGDQFNIPVGTNVEGKMVTALRRLGFDLVFDVDWGADSTIMEETTEFIERIQEHRDLPMFTSCCPAWIRYMEFYHPEMLNHLSTCRSPIQEISSILKTYYAEKQGIDPKKIVAVTIMPCTAKKYEIIRNEHVLPNGCMPTDYSLTTRELSDMLTEAGIMFAQLPDGTFDRVLGESTGAGDIFGASGGVMEAALRQAAATLSGSDEDAPLEFKEVRGLKGVKEATYTVGDVTLNVCAVSNLNNAEIILQKIKNGEVNYDFVEVMACPGGCVNGGGQPIHSAYEKMTQSVAGERAQGLYRLDSSKKRRRSGENVELETVYREYLGAPGSEKAHKLMHTHYSPRPRFAVDNDRGV